MSISHSATVRNALANLILDAVDQDVGAGNLVILTSGDVEVATLPLTDPVGTVTGPTITFSAITSDTNATGGTAGKYNVTDNSGDIIFSGSVTATGGGGDLELSSVGITAGDTVSVTSFTYTAPV